MSINIGIPPSAIREFEAAPIVSLGVVHQDGEEGLFGRGVYIPPTAPYIEACNALNRG